MQRVDTIIDFAAVDKFGVNARRPPRASLCGHMSVGGADDMPQLARHLARNCFVELHSQRSRVYRRLAVTAFSDGADR
jgi:hypothetical protein